MFMDNFERIAICGELISDDERIISLFEKYKKKNGEPLKHTVWLDRENQVLFGADENYKNTTSYDTVYLTKPEDFLSDHRYGFQRYRDFASSGYPFRDITKTTEYICEHVPLVGKVKNASVLVIGSGPSLKNFDVSEASKHDQVWVCNDFYRSDILDDVDIDLYYISNQVQGTPETLAQMHDRSNMTCCFDTVVYRDIRLTMEYKRLFGDRAFLFGTRFFATLGVGQRLLALAAHLGARKISFVGIDGKLREDFETGECYTSFGDRKKHLPPNQNFASQNREYILFWEYMKELIGGDIEYKNYGFSCEGNVTAKIFGKELFNSKRGL